MLKLNWNLEKNKVEQAEICSTDIEQRIMDYLIADGRATTNEKLQTIWEWLEVNDITSLRAGDISLERCKATVWGYNTIEIDCYYSCEGFKYRHQAEFEKKKSGLWWNISLKEEEVEKEEEIKQD